MFAEMLCGLLMWVWRGIAWLLTRKHAGKFARGLGASSFIMLAVFKDDLGPNAPWIWGAAIVTNVLLTILMILASRWQRRQ